MPNMIGGDQYDPDYAPHLYKDGKFIGDQNKKPSSSKTRKVKSGREYCIAFNDKIIDGIFTNRKKAFEILKIHKAEASWPHGYRVLEYLKR